MRAIEVELKEQEGMLQRQLQALQAQTDEQQRLLSEKVAALGHELEVTVARARSETTE